MMCALHNIISRWCQDGVLNEENEFGMFSVHPVQITVSVNDISRVTLRLCFIPKEQPSHCMRG